MQAGQGELPQSGKRGWSGPSIPAEHVKSSGPLRDGTSRGEGRSSWMSCISRSPRRKRTQRNNLRSFQRKREEEAYASSSFLLFCARCGGLLARPCLGVISRSRARGTSSTPHFLFVLPKGRGDFAPPGAGCFWQTPARGDFALRREALLARPKRAEKAA